MTTNTQRDAIRSLIITRTFAAPRDRVWQFWTQSQHLAQWWGPDGFTNPECEVEVRPGGYIRINMQGSDGTIYPMVGVFTEVVAPERLVFTGSSLDSNGKKLYEVLQTITLRQSGDATELVLEAYVTSTTKKATPYLTNMESGWNQSLGKLDRLLIAYGKEVT